MSKINQENLFAEMDGAPAIVRYSIGDRLTHWLVAISFVLAALSGFAFFHPALFGLTSLFGSATWVRILHPFMGGVMFLSFALLAMRFWHHNMVTKSDIQWMKQIGDVVTGHDHKAPPPGMYNAGQKGLFWSLIILMLGLLVTGVVAWQTYFAGVFPPEVRRIAILIHAFCGFALVCAIFIHVIAALWVSYSVSAMIRGKVSYGWARNNHRLWYDEIVAAEKTVIEKK